MSSYNGRRIQPPDTKRARTNLTAEQIDWVRALPTDFPVRSAQVMFFRKFRRDVSDGSIRKYRGTFSQVDNDVSRKDG